MKTLDKKTARKDFLAISDTNEKELYDWFKLAAKLKKETKTGKKHPVLAGKTLAMYFEKPSTRTRISFETGMAQLGGHALYLSPRDLQIGRGETIADTAQVLSRYVNCVMGRVFKHSTLTELAANATIPIINGLSDYTHPCQGITDYFTILEKKKSLKGLKLAYIGDGNNVAHSLIFGGAKLGVSVVCVAPKGYEPMDSVMKEASGYAKKTGACITTTNDIKEGLEGADILYTDVWASMGQEEEHEKRVKLFMPYQLNSKNLALTGKKDTLVMHCLPAHRGEEITNEVVDGPNSVVFDQAENRLHTQKALMVSLIR
ncbi:ornithine carbamoyltransferase [Elusimicrobiota bacterium]